MVLSWHANHGESKIALGPLWCIQLFRHLIRPMGTSCRDASPLRGYRATVARVTRERSYRDRLAEKIMRGRVASLNPDVQFRTCKRSLQVWCGSKGAGFRSRGNVATPHQFSLGHKQGPLGGKQVAVMWRLNAPGHCGPEDRWFKSNMPRQFGAFCGLASAGLERRSGVSFWPAHQSLPCHV